MLHFVKRHCRVDTASKIIDHFAKMENLWKKGTTAHGPVYVDLFPQLKKSRSSKIPRRTSEDNHQNINKDNEVSTKFRLLGNNMFQQHKITEAIDHYNESLCFAENGTENVSLAYANRASCFMKLKMYAEALVDLELAKRADYPAQLMPKLNHRQAVCLRELKTHPQRQPYQPKLSFAAKMGFPCLANVLDFKYNREFGRFVVANIDIDVGKIVLVEPNFASVAINGGRKTCTNCLKTSGNFIACSNCVDTMYCSVECMNRDVAHQYACGEFQSVDGSMNLYIRTILIALSLFKTVENLMDFVEEVVSNHADEVPTSFTDAQFHYAVFLALQPAVYSCDEKDIFIDAQKIYTQLLLTPSIKMLFDSVEKRRFLKHLVVHHLLVTLRNRFQSTTKDNQLEITEIAPMACLFNHSCAANVFNHVVGNQVVFITIRPIKTGEQLFISYLGEETDNTIEFRRSFLMDNFGFLCKCDKCQPHCLLADRMRMKSDPQFKYVQRAYGSAYAEQSKRRMLKDVCARFLRKYGHLPWSEELNFVTLCYLKWLYNHMNDDFELDFNRDVGISV